MNFFNFSDILKKTILPMNKKNIQGKTHDILK